MNDFKYRFRMEGAVDPLLSVGEYYDKYLANMTNDEIKNTLLEYVKESCFNGGFVRDKKIYISKLLEASVFELDYIIEDFSLFGDTYFVYKIVK